MRIILIVETVKEAHFLNHCNSLKLRKLRNSLSHQATVEISIHASAKFVVQSPDFIQTLTLFRQ
jgi:hypothetical protein